MFLVKALLWKLVRVFPSKKSSSSANVRAMRRGFCERSLASKSPSGQAQAGHRSGRVRAHAICWKKKTVQEAPSDLRHGSSRISRLSIILPAVWFLLLFVCAFCSEFFWAQENQVLLHPKIESYFFNHSSSGPCWANVCPRS